MTMLKQNYKENESVLPDEGKGPTIPRTVKKMRTTIKAPMAIELGLLFSSRARKKRAAMQTCCTYIPTKMCWIALGKNRPPVSLAGD
jgi:hypothetical protein